MPLNCSVHLFERNETPNVLQHLNGAIPPSRIHPNQYNKFLKRPETERLWAFSLLELMIDLFG